MIAKMKVTLVMKINLILFILFILFILYINKIVVEEDIDTSSYEYNSNESEDETFIIEKSCSNPSFLTLSEYEESDLPQLISIKVYNKQNNTFVKGSCVTKDELQEWIKTPENIMSIYSKPNENNIDNPVGYGTKPLNQYVVRLPQNQIYVS